MKALFSLLVLTLFAVSTAATASPRFSVFGAGNYYNLYDKDDSTTFTPSLAFGGGIGFEVPLGRVVAIELGGSYLQRAFTKDLQLTRTTTSTIEYKYAGVNVPLILRFWVSNIFTFGLGGYYMKYLGDVSTSYTSSTVKTAIGRNYSFADVGLKKFDAGVVGVLGFNIPLKKMSLMIEGRYDYGLINQNANGAPALKTQAIYAVAGFRFGKFGR